MSELVAEVKGILDDLGVEDHFVAVDADCPDAVIVAPHTHPTRLLVRLRPIPDAKAWEWFSVWSLGFAPTPRDGVIAAIETHNRAAELIG